MNATSQTRIDSLQALRFFAAALVVLHHFEIFSGATGYGSHPVPEFFGHKGGLGAFGVDIFFVISGFIMLHTTRTGGGGIRFILKRSVNVL